MNLSLRNPIVLLIAAWLWAALAYAEEPLSILSQNMNHLFDDIDDGNRAKLESSKRYQRRIHLAANKFLRQFEAPQIIALQEVENIYILKDIENLILKSGGPRYQSVLLEGNDVSGIDVGYLIKSDLRIIEKKSLFRNDRLDDRHSALFSRPPLLIEVCQSNCVTLVNLHLRSMRGLSSGKKGKTVAKKRLAQATRLAKWINQFQTRHPQKSLMILGDFNALQPPDNYSDIVGTILGNPDNSRQSYRTKDWIKKDLVDLTQQVPQSRRFSYVYKGEQQTLDYMLVNQNFKPEMKTITYSRIDRQLSDHAGLLAKFSW